MEKNTMRRSAAVFCNVWSNPGTLMNQITLKRAFCFLALAGVTFTYASAKEPADEKEPASKLKRTAAPASAAEAAIPACLEKLKLSQPQQTEGKQIVPQYDVALHGV